MCSTPFGGSRKPLGLLSSTAVAAMPGNLSSPPWLSGHTDVTVVVEPASTSHWTWSAAPTRTSFAVHVPPETGSTYEQPGVVLLSATSVQPSGPDPSQCVAP